MTEAEAMEVVMLASDNAMAAYSMFLTILFAYMTVAYFVGRNLTPFQVIAASGMYFVSCVTIMAATFLYVRTWGVIKRDFPGGVEALESTPIWNETLWQTTLIVTMTAGLVIGFYFMYRVRNPKIE